MKKQYISSKRDQYTVVLEDIHSQNKVFGEALSLVRDEVKDNTRKLEKVDERLFGVEGRLSDIDTRLSGVETDLEVIKNELAIIRHNQVTRDEFKLLETRVSRLEKAGRN